VSDVLTGSLLEMQGPAVCDLKGGLSACGYSYVSIARRVVYPPVVVAMCL